MQLEKLKNLIAFFITIYKVRVHFSETSDKTITDKINRLIQKECADMGRYRKSGSAHGKN